MPRNRDNKPPAVARLPRIKKTKTKKVSKAAAAKQLQQNISEQAELDQNIPPVDPPRQNIEEQVTGSKDDFLCLKAVVEQQQKTIQELQKKQNKKTTPDAPVEVDEDTIDKEKSKDLLLEISNFRQQIAHLANEVKAKEHELKIIRNRIDARFKLAEYKRVAISNQTHAFDAYKKGMILIIYVKSVKLELLFYIKTFKFYFTAKEAADKYLSEKKYLVQQVQTFKKKHEDVTFKLLASQQTLNQVS